MFLIRKYLKYLKLYSILMRLFKAIVKSSHCTCMYAIGFCISRFNNDSQCWSQSLRLEWQQTWCADKEHCRKTSFNNKDSSIMCERFNINGIVLEAIAKMVFERKYSHHSASAALFNLLLFTYELEYRWSIEMLEVKWSAFCIFFSS